MLWESENFPIAQEAGYDSIKIDHRQIILRAISLDHLPVVLLNYKILQFSLRPSLTMKSDYS